jgi:hypothetical protein
MGASSGTSSESSSLSDLETILHRFGGVGCSSPNIVVIAGSTDEIMCN